MDENESMTVQESAANPEGAYDPDDWDDLDLSAVTAEDGDDGTDDADAFPAPEADQPTAEADESEAPAAGTEPEEKQAETDQFFDLKRFGETRRVGKDEVVALAQKGLDYDHIRAERDTARTEAKRLGALESFLRELAQTQGLHVDELMDTTRARLLAEREGLSDSAALQRVRLERERRAAGSVPEPDPAAQRRHSAFVRFVRECPDVDPKTIPQEVWAAFGAGGDLTDLYRRYENRQLRESVRAMQAGIDAAERNARNRERSAGSQKSAGKGAETDAFDRAWYDGN